MMIVNGPDLAGRPERTPVDAQRDAVRKPCRQRPVVGRRSAVGMQGELELLARVKGWKRIVHDGEWRFGGSSAAQTDAATNEERRHKSDMGWPGSPSLHRHTNFNAAPIHLHPCTVG